MKLKSLILSLFLGLASLPFYGSFRQNLVFAQANLVDETTIQEYKQSVLDELKKDFDCCEFTQDDFNKATNLKNVIENFVKESDKEGVSPENFEDYVKAYLSKGQARTDDYKNLLDRNDFENYCNKDKVVHLYRGIHESKFAEEFKNGIVYIGGVNRGPYHAFSSSWSQFGHACYTTTSEKDAFSYSKRDKLQRGEDSAAFRGTGYVVEMAIDLNTARVIDNDELSKQVLALKYFYPEFCNLVGLFGKYVDPKFFYSYHFGLLKKLYEEKKGIDLENLIESIDKSELLKGRISSPPNQTKEQFDREFLESHWRNFVEVCCGDAIFRQDFESLLAQDFTKPHYVNKAFAVLNDKGLMARLLGFDVLFRTTKNKKIDISNLNNSSLRDDFYMIVNPEVVTVCSEYRDVTQGFSTAQLFDFCGSL